MTALAIATFADEGAWLRARTRAAAAERHVAGEWLPYHSDALGEGTGAEGAGGRGIMSATVLAGLAGGGGLFALTVWSAVYAYRFDSGGRPLFSWPAFVPAPVEFGALAAAIGGVLMLLWRARLTRLHHPAFDWDEVARASQDEFVLALRCDAGEDATRALALLASAGANHTRLIES